MPRQKIEAVIEKNDAGYSAESHKFGVKVHEHTLNEVKDRIRYEISKHFHSDDDPLSVDDFRFTYPLGSFFGKDSVLNAKAFASRIDMNPALLAQYIAGIKSPSEKQLTRIQDGIRAVGVELAQLQLALASPPAELELVRTLEATEPQTTREVVLEDFLRTHLEDNDFSYTSEGSSYYFKIVAYGSRGLGERDPELVIKLPSENSTRRNAIDALRKVVEDTLQLRYDLQQLMVENRFTDEITYPVQRRRGLAYKLFMIDAFMTLYHRERIEMTITEDACHIMAVSPLGKGRQVADLILHYHPKRQGEQEVFADAISTFPQRFAAQRGYTLDV